MNNLKSKLLCKSILLISMIVVLFSSCKNDEEESSDYVGTWSTVESMTENGVSIQCKDIMTFTNGEFNDLLQLYDSSTDKYLNYIKLKGTISVSGSTMNIKITEIGITSFDLISGEPTGTIITYKEGSSEYDYLFSQTGQPKSFKSQYSVSGNKMTIKTDNNNDGDYSDENETTIYTKQ